MNERYHIFKVFVNLLTLLYVQTTLLLILMLIAKIGSDFAFKLNNDWLVVKIYFRARDDFSKR